MNKVQQESLRHDIEMAAFHVWLSVHGKPDGFTHWIYSSDVDGFIKHLIETVYEREDLNG